MNLTGHASFGCHVVKQPGTSRYNPAVDLPLAGLLGSLFLINLRNYTMSDTYYDLEENRRYAEHFITVAADFTSLDPVVDRLISRQRELLADLELCRTTFEDVRADTRSSQAQFRDLRDEARTQLGRLFTYLQSQEGEVDFEFTRFYPTGRKSDIGKSVADLRGNLERVLDGLNQYPLIPGAEDWKRKMQALYDQYVPKSGEVSGRQSSARLKSGSASQATSAWRRHYRGCRLVMEGLLIQAGREGELPLLFLHLQMGASRTTSSAETSAPVSDVS